jgi:hypothetical protein
MREALGVGSQGVVLPGRPILADIEVVRRLERARTAAIDPMPGGVTATSIRAAIAWLESQPVLKRAAIAAGSATDLDLVDAIARAIVAKALSEARGEIGTGPDALFLLEERRKLVFEVATSFSPQKAGLGGWLFDKVKDLAEAQATAYGRGRRHELMQGISSGMGDILLYQRRGCEILAAIENKIKEISINDANIVLVGHSLGGIMLVDLLSNATIAQPLGVRKLVTVGSQAPMLYKFDALETLRPPRGTPPFSWLNFFDRNDFLSFCASRAFPKSSHQIIDFEINSGICFPESHGAYFRIPTFFKRLAKEWR